MRYPSSSKTLLGRVGRVAARAGRRLPAGPAAAGGHDRRAVRGGGRGQRPAARQAARGVRGARGRVSTRRRQAGGAGVAKSVSHVRRRLAAADGPLPRVAGVRDGAAEGVAGARRAPAHCGGAAAPGSDRGAQVGGWAQELRDAPQPARSVSTDLMRWRHACSTRY